MDSRHEGTLAVALAAAALTTAWTAGSVHQEPTEWTVEIDVDAGNPLDTMRNALSPTAGAPRALANPDGDFDSRIRYLFCLNAEERAMGSVAPVMLLFRRPPRPAALAGGVRGQLVPVELRTVWGEETLVFGATHYPGRDRIGLSLEDGDARSGESSHDEFLGRLLDGSWTATDSVVVELDWEGVGAVRYAYSLDGAAAAIREAGAPCGVG